VLAGGRSRRFGSDKAQAEIAGKPLIEHAVEGLRQFAEAVVVCGRVMDGVTSLPDRPAPDMGPLGGLNAALHHAAANGFHGVLSIGCDMPLLPHQAVDELIGDEAAIVHGQHLVGYWPSILAPALDGHLILAEDRSILAWLGRAKPRVVTLAGPPLPNINTPGDLAELAADWGKHNR
jgi:molybdopterin-guanine dinucleotide biosynthesis protein A